jgi:hypothetical protein
VSRLTWLSRSGADATLSGAMESTQSVTARGTGIWGGQSYRVELATTETTWSDALGQRTASRVRHSLLCPPPVGARDFDSDDARAAFIEGSFSELHVESVADSPRVPESALDEIVGEKLSRITFVLDYLQMSFDGPPLTLWVWPRIHRSGGELRRDDPGYADALLAQIGKLLVGVDELLDLGLALDFDDGTRLSVPLDGTDSVGPEVAMFNGEQSRVWMTGELPFTRTVYIELLDEGVDASRPVEAIVDGDYFVLPRTVPDGEHWQFAPGSRVRCEWRELSGGQGLLAVELAD